MNAIAVSLVCPVCGAGMEKTKTTRAAHANTSMSRFRCTCGHSEEREEAPAAGLGGEPGSGIAGFQEFPLETA